MSIRVDVRSSFSLVGYMLKWLVVPLLLPLSIALYEQQDVVPFLMTGSLLLSCGGAWSS